MSKFPKYKPEFIAYQSELMLIAFLFYIDNREMLKAMLLLMNSIWTSFPKIWIIFGIPYREIVCLKIYNFKPDHYLKNFYN
jgi:hypothetical protein